MSVIMPFVGHAQLTAQQNLAAFIQHAQGSRIFHGAHAISWHDNSWDLTPWVKYRGSGRSYKPHFVDYDSQGRSKKKKPLPQPFMDATKALAAYAFDHNGASAPYRWIIALRVVDKAFKELGRQSDITALDIDVLNKATEILLSRYEDPTVDGISLEKVAEAVSRLCLCKRDMDALAAILDIPKAAAIVQAFGLMIDEVSALEDLDALGLDGRTASTALRLFGAEAGRKFRENPYLLTLLEPWAKVDSAALASGIMPVDERRLLAAVDMAAARAFRTTENNLGGHTVIRGAHLRRSVREMLGKSAATHADAAVQTALRAGLINEIAPDHYQARAPAHMEREIERCVLERLERSRPAVDRVMVATVIGEVEREDGILLASEQKEAVLTALSSGFAVITGGAGTGKSTVVKAIRRAHLRSGGGDYIQVALSGRAARRLREATGADAMTIYRFMKDAGLGKLSMKKGLLVVDEFSMVGTPDLWQLLTMSPPEFDVVLVGDPAQLPPIKAGNPASVLTQAASVPKTTLRRAQRQAASTGIPDVAEAIREGSFPDLPTFDLAAASRPGVYLWNCPKSDVPSAVIQAFEALVGAPAPRKHPGLIARLHQMDVQILAMTRWTQNSYDRPTGKLDSTGTEITVDIMNGALGVIANTIDKHALARFDDGTETVLSRNDLARVLRGWAISVHKAQGSAFKTVLIPVVRSRLLDRAMLYTAVTRARLTAVLIGECALMRHMVGATPRALQRLQALDIDRTSRPAG